LVNARAKDIQGKQLILLPVVVKVCWQQDFVNAFIQVTFEKLFGSGVRPMWIPTLQFGGTSEETKAWNAHDKGMTCHPTSSPMTYPGTGTGKT
jgi:hypothetical protein